MSVVDSNTTQFRLEFERLLDSETFRNPEGVRRLLTYLGEKSLAGRGAALKESTIGIEAFDKSPDYDPQHDPTVRVLAGKLRRKLDDYYRTEGAGNPVRIAFPKGHYLLTFELCQPEASDEGKPPDIPWRRISWVLAAVLAAVLLLVAYWRVSLYRSEAEAAQAWTPELKLLWGSYAESNRPILIVLGTPLFTKFEGSFFRDPRLNRWEEVQQSKRFGPSASPYYNFTGLGETHGVFLLSRLFRHQAARVDMKRSVALSWEDVGGHNVIFLGSAKYNPQLKDLPVERDFMIEGGSLRNLRPRPGEPAIYPETWTPSNAELLEDHALVTRVPGLHGHGEVTVLGASSTEGTWAAAEYMTNPRHAAELVARLRLPSGKLPAGYQVVIRARFKDQVPIQTAYVTHRILKTAR